MNLFGKIKLIYGAVMAALTLVLGGLTLALAADLYFSAAGETVYSAEAVSARLRVLALPFFIWAAVAVAGAVLFEFLPEEKAARRTDRARILRRLKPRIGRKEGRELFRLERVRAGIWIVSALFALASAAVILFLIFGGSRFGGGNINEEVLAFVRSALPWIGGSFGLFFLAALSEGILLRREVPLAKKLAALSHPVTSEKTDMGWEKALIAVRIVLLAAAAVFIILGAVNGGASDVFIKAVNICTECIGLG